MPHVAATATRVPDHYYRQDTLAATFKKYCQMKQYDLDFDLVDQLYENAEIGGRYFAQPLDDFFDPPAHGTVNEAAVNTAVDLASDAVTEVLDAADLPPGDVSNITSLASTLIAIPTIEARVMNRVDFASDVKRNPINGLGCMGGAAGMARVTDYLDGHPDEAAILIASEMGGTGIWLGGVQGYLESAVSQMAENPSIYSDIVSQIVTTALFGDGVAVALCTGDDHPLADATGPKVLGTRSVFMDESQDIMEVRMMEKGFMTALSADVPQYARDGMTSVMDDFLGEHGITVDDIDEWMLHPGGPKVVDAIQDAFDLSDEDLQHSFDVLDDVGNVSAPTVLFVLDRLMDADVPEGSYGLMAAMGPGFSEELILFQW